MDKILKVMKEANPPTIINILLLVLEILSKKLSNSKNCQLKDFISTSLHSEELLTQECLRVQEIVHSAFTNKIMKDKLFRKKRMRQK